jgi:lipopolysaccharide transport system permease protein
LLLILVNRNLKIRYKNSALGFFWSLLTPVLLIAIYGIFAHILKFNKSRPDYLQFLIVGIVVWQFLAMCLNDSLGVILGNANLIKKTSFPRFILPLAMVTANLINFLLTMVVLVIYLIAVHAVFGNFAILLVVLLTQCALCLGIALILSTTNVFFRDTEHILSVLVLAWFFLTPVFYPINEQMALLRPDLQWLAFLNPMTGIVCGYRSVLMSDNANVSSLTWISYGMSWLIMVIGIAFFQKLVPRLADEM